MTTVKLKTKTKKKKHLRTGHYYKGERRGRRGRTIEVTGEREDRDSRQETPSQERSPQIPCRQGPSSIQHRSTRHSHSHEDGHSRTHIAETYTDTDGRRETYLGDDRQADGMMAAPAPIQDRTTEFRSILSQAQKRLASSKASGRQSLQANSTARTTSADVPATGGRPARSEFARRAAEIGRGIASTTGKLQRLAQCRFSLLYYFSDVEGQEDRDGIYRY